MATYATAGIAPAPRPCTARAPTRNAIDGAHPAASSPTAHDTGPGGVPAPPPSHPASRGRTPARLGEQGRSGRGHSQEASHVSLVIIVVAIVLAAYVVLSALLSINVIGPTEVGLVQKRFSLK